MFLVVAGVTPVVGCYNNGIRHEKVFKNVEFRVQRTLGKTTTMYTIESHRFQHFQHFRFNTLERSKLEKNSEDTFSIFLGSRFIGFKNIEKFVSVRTDPERLIRARAMIFLSGR